MKNTKNNQNLVTTDGLKKLKEELKQLMTVSRRAIADDIQRAKEFGDLSENAAYTSAMEARDLNESRIAELEELIGNAKLVVSDKANSDGVISVGDTVTLKSDKLGEMTITLVGMGEGDPLNSKVSSDTPLAQAILGKKIKAKVLVDLPAGRVEYDILKVK